MGICSVFAIIGWGEPGNRFRYSKNGSSGRRMAYFKKWRANETPIKSGRAAPPLLNSATSLITMIGIDEILSIAQSQSMIQKAWGDMSIFRYRRLCVCGERVGE